MVQIKCNNDRNETSLKRLKASIRSKDLSGFIKYETKGSTNRLDICIFCTYI